MGYLGIFPGGVEYYTTVELREGDQVWIKGDKSYGNGSGTVEKKAEKMICTLPVEYEDM